jgi:hypothetical protein
MPYIKAGSRQVIDAELQPLIRLLLSRDDDGGINEGDLGIDEGDLNYVITRLLYHAIRRKRYGEMNRIMGVLECAKQEFYARIVRPYEDQKRVENGDCYDEWLKPQTD